MVQIAGLRKTSLIDFPEKISTVVFTQGCNFNCGYCHNPELIAVDKDGEYMDLNYFWDFLDQRKKVIDGVVITGGEPLLQKDIIDFIKKIKNKNLKVKVDTNGTCYSVLEKLISDNLIDYIAMDIKNDFKEYQKITSECRKRELDNIKKSIKLIMNSNLKYEFRTTVVPGFHSETQVEKIAQFLKGADKYVIQNFRSEKTYKKEFEQINRFPDKDLDKFRQIAKKYIKKVEIRN